MVLLILNILLKKLQQISWNCLVDGDREGLSHIGSFI